MALAPRVFTVSQDGSADFSSIYRALLQACNGDVVRVADGEYSPTTTRELFPLFVPTGGAVAGIRVGQVPDYG